MERSCTRPPWFISQIRPSAPVGEARQRFLPGSSTVQAMAPAHLEPEEREFLLHVNEVLAPPRERLEATAILAPRLQLLVETMAEDWKRLATIAGFEAPLRHLNNSKQSVYASRYDARLRALVAEQYASDIDRIEYRFPG